MLRDHGLGAFMCHCYDDGDLGPHADCCLHHCPTMARFDTSYLDIDILDERSIRNMIGVVNRVSVFFAAHPKRQRKLEETIDQAQSGSAAKKLKDLCRTRWVERIDALD